MYVEAFTQAKDPKAPETNDDRLVVHDARVFAVIDGVTDKSGAQLENGMSRGQMAGVVLDTRLRALAKGSQLGLLGTAELVSSFTEALRTEYARRGILNAVLASPNLRFAAQMAAAVVTEVGWRVVVVGDCGARVHLADGSTRLLTASTPHDDITAIWRSVVLNHALGAGADPATALAVGRAYALKGTSNFLAELNSFVSEADHADLAAAALNQAAAEYPALGRNVVATVLSAGILGLGQYRNSSGPLSFVCLDGTDVPVEGVHDQTFGSSSVVTIELFTDGYFGPPSAPEPKVSVWEEHFRYVESTDPHKVAEFRSTKGSAQGKFTDDRTVLIIKPEVGE